MRIPTAMIVALTGAALLLGGCDRNRDRTPTTTVADPETPAAPLPHYEIPSALASEFPEVAGFVRRFLETCLANDYDGYREMVSHRFDPETKDRFEAMYLAIRAVRVELIERIELGALPTPTYRVVSEIEFDPETQLGKRHQHRRIAILVFPEGDNSGAPWRMVQAPAGMQPEPAHKKLPTTTSAPASQPATPDYPWDASGDD